MSSLGGVGWWLVRFLPILAVLIYAFWPTLVWAESTWRNEPDYSHGYLVPLLALLLLANRSESFPGVRERPSYGGVWLILLAVVMRFAGRLLYMDFFDGYAILPLVAGIVWVMLGPAAMRWSLPAIGFLFFMIPLPYQAETLLSWKLQGIATGLSTAILRVLGQPAVSEGHVIWIADQRLMVEEACSGLRIFIGVAALACFWAASIQRSWWDRLVLLASVIPLAIFVNAMRIVAVGLLYQWFGSEDKRALIHDWTGYLMIPVAFGLLWLLKCYWQAVYRPVEQVTARDFVHGLS
ncbi:Transmembrane exosortase [Allorhodopirellula solitaria]|uniref:Transmembrane exosortase n=2 Tax=Allorhodopirellula solitaria TaxID=2527987 RepID=A0A5C5X0W4_9BACT|nr:Transmembrane exosortase [Allorhodopirellula solitaria]